MTPLRAAVRGAVAAALGTAAMDALWYFRYRQALACFRLSQSSRAAAAASSPARLTSSVWMPGTAAMAPGESRVSGAPA
jgi:hypothetical protein